MMTFATKKETNGSAVILMPTQLLVMNRRSLEESVMDVHADGARCIALDFSGTTYIDSAGLGMLVKVQRLIDMKGGSLQLKHLDPSLKELLSLTKLDAFFIICD